MKKYHIWVRVVVEEEDENGKFRNVQQDEAGAVETIADLDDADLEVKVGTYFHPDKAFQAQETIQNFLEAGGLGVGTEN